MHIDDFGAFHYGENDFVYPPARFVSFKELKNGDIELIDDSKNTWVFKKRDNIMECELIKQSKVSHD